MNELHRTKKLLTHRLQPHQKYVIPVFYSYKKLRISKNLSENCVSNNNQKTVRYIYISLCLLATTTTT